MSITSDLSTVAEQALQQMLAQGFDQAQVSASHTAQDELNVNHNEASLLRSTENLKLSLLGIAGGRMASTELGDWQPDAVRERIAQLKADVQSAPQDEANAVSSGRYQRPRRVSIERSCQKFVSCSAEQIASDHPSKRSSR